MNTSYFAKYRGPNGISIAVRSPKGFHGKRYKQLYPKWWFYQEYLDTGDPNHYVKYYKKEVLNKLNPKRVFEELGKDAVLLCYEEPGKFCHRHLVADWLAMKLGIQILEI